MYNERFTIYLRYHLKDAEKMVEYVTGILYQYTSFWAVPINDIEINESWFDISPDDMLVSLDKDVATRLNIPYYQISRVFDLEGNVVSRLENSPIPFRGNHVKILDTDMVYGDTIKLACERFKTNKFSIPININPKFEDLIDIEDLYLPLSWVQDNNGIIYNCNYLINNKFFTKRTSLPEELYPHFCKLFDITPQWI